MRKVLIIAQILFCSEKSSPEKKPLIVMHGKRTSFREHSLFNIKEFIPKRNLMNVMNVGRHLVKFRPHSISESSHQRKIVSTECDKIFSQLNLFIIGESIPERNPLNVMNVGKLLVLNLYDACKHISEKTYKYIECGKCFMLYS